MADGLQNTGSDYSVAINHFYNQLRLCNIIFKTTMDNRIISHHKWGMAKEAVLLWSEELNKYTYGHYNLLMDNNTKKKIA